ncbi:unnamed protein product [Arabidopsis lyrata]|nr:unnamed protein product [Arabidopsis lyrata]
MKDRIESPTSSRSVTQTTNGSHQFVIQGYSLAKGIGVGKHIASDQWTIFVYPDGKNPEDNSSYVSVFIVLASEGTEVRALFELALVDQSGTLDGGLYTLKYRERDTSISSDAPCLRHWILWKARISKFYNMPEANNNDQLFGT